MHRLVIAFCVLIGASLASCSPSNSPATTTAAPAPARLEGVWRLAHVRHETGEAAGPHTFDLQPAVIIFTATHYAHVGVSGFMPRALLGDDATEAESGRAYADFVGHTGTYARDGDKLVLTPLVAKDPARMQAGSRIEYTLAATEGDWVLTTTTPEDGRVLMRIEPVKDEPIALTADMQRLQGVWRRSQRIIETGKDKGDHLNDMQAGYYIFSGDKFAANFVTAFAPRPLLSAEPTDEERAAVFGPFASFAGRFSIEDGEIMLWPAVTMNPNNMRGRPFQPIKLEWEGDDAWFIYTGEGAVLGRTRLTRVED